MSVSFGKVQGNFDSLIGTIWRSNLLSLHILIIKTNDYFVQINGMINYPTLHLNFPLVIFLVNALSRIRSSHRMIVVANLWEIKSSIKYTLYGFSQYLFMHFFFLTLHSLVQNGLKKKIKYLSNKISFACRISQENPYPQK